MTALEGAMSKGERGSVSRRVSVYVIALGPDMSQPAVVFSAALAHRKAARLHIEGLDVRVLEAELVIGDEVPTWGGDAA
jgi:hypothetical protein